MGIFSNIVDFFKNIPSIRFSAADFLDIAFVWVILYYGIRLIRDTRAYQLVKGLIILLVFYGITGVFEMQASNSIFRYIWQYIIIILIVVFQQEIRQIFSNLGRIGKDGVSLFSFLRSYQSDNYETVSNAIIEICKAVERMSESKTGALIVLEKDMFLDDIINNGTFIDAQVSHELIGNIFFPKSPLHDGAAIIRAGRVQAAGCVLPLTANKDISSDLGTRHRAALGMSEVSDAMVVVVSEETGSISVARTGNLKSDYTEAALREEMLNYLTVNPAVQNTGINKILKGKKKNEKAE